MAKRKQPEQKNVCVFYFMIEAIPNKSNPEHLQYSGAYVNVWVKADTQKAALEKAKQHISEENWHYVRLEDAFLAQRAQYNGSLESLECYDTAYATGLASVFYTWPIKGT